MVAGRRERQTQLAREAAAARTARLQSEDMTTPEGARAQPASQHTPPARRDSPSGESATSARETGSGSTAHGARAARRRAQGAAVQDATAAGDADAVTRTAGKGRPTPRRRDVEASNRRPVVITDRKEAKKKARQARQDAYARQQAGIAAGDERYFLPRDRGPARKYARDAIDARWNIGELMVPVALVALVAMMFGSIIPDVVSIVAVVTYVVLLAALLDSVVIGQTIKARARKKFGADKVPPWTAWYAAMRALMIRRLRTPKPQVNRGQKVD